MSARTDSTSSQARRFLKTCRRLKAAVTPCCFIAWRQLAGRGRGARRWRSDPGQGLYLSVLLPDLELATLSGLPLSAALEAAKVIAPLVSSEVRIKWPNDLLLGGRKVAGILVESASRGSAGADAVVGVGVNVHHRERALPHAAATSMFLEGGGETDLARLGVDVAAALFAAVESPRPMSEVVEEYRTWSQHRLGDPIVCRRGEERLEGRFAGFGGDGSLRLDRGGRIATVHSSEIVQS